jgi:hypothetical protein
MFGAPWPRRFEHLVGSLEPARADGRFGQFEVRRHRFERTMDAHTFVVVTRTYGGPHSDERDKAPIRLIDRELGGTITKRTRVLYLCHRTEPS